MHVQLFIFYFSGCWVKIQSMKELDGIKDRAVWLAIDFIIVIQALEDIASTDWCVNIHGRNPQRISKDALEKIRNP